MKLSKIKKFIQKHIWLFGIGLIVVVGVLYFFVLRKPAAPETLVAGSGEFLQQVSVSGKVVSEQSVNLSFEQAGIVRGVYVKAGDKVVAGKLLASQDTAQLSTQLAEMQAGIDLQKAKLAQLLAGSSDQDIKIAEDEVASANQDLDAAYVSAVIDLNSAYLDIYNAYSTIISIRGSYFSGFDQAGIKVENARNRIAEDMADAKMYLDLAKANSSATNVSNAITHMITALNNVYGQVSIVRDQCDEGVYYSTVSAADKSSLDTKKTNINSAINEITAANQSINSYKIALQQAKNNLELVKAPARTTDIAVYQAQIKQAEAGAQNVLTQIRKRQVFAPMDGTITVVNAKVGSIFSATEPAVSMISAGEFQVESYVPEIYVSLVKVGNEAHVTLDSYGPDRIFIAKVISIDPSETIKDGVSTYKTMLQFENVQEEIKDGMSANVVIITNKKDNVISIPQGLVMNRNGKKYVKVVRSEAIVEVEVQVGDVSSSGQVEIISGLDEGDVLPLN